MLVLKRKPGEAIQISEDIFILVCETGLNKVKIGINAPGKEIYRITQNEFEQRTNPEEPINGRICHVEPEKKSS